MPKLLAAALLLTLTAFPARAMSVIDSLCLAYSTAELSGVGSGSHGGQPYGQWLAYEGASYVSAAFAFSEARIEPAQIESPTYTVSHFSDFSYYQCPELDSAFFETGSCVSLQFAMPETPLVISWGGVSADGSASVGAFDETSSSILFSCPVQGSQSILLSANPGDIITLGSHFVRSVSLEGISGSWSQVSGWQLDVVPAVPEPATLSLLAIAGLGATTLARRRKV